MQIPNLGAVTSDLIATHVSLQSRHFRSFAFGVMVIPREFLKGVNRCMLSTFNFRASTHTKCDAMERDMMYVDDLVDTQGFLQCLQENYL